LGRDASLGPQPPGPDMLTGACRPLLGFPARDALPRRRAFRRRRRNRTRGNITGSERESGVGRFPIFARACPGSELSERLTTAPGRPPRARRAASIRRACAGMQRPGSALGCTWSGHNGARASLQEVAKHGTMAGSQPQRRGEQSSAPEQVSVERRRERATSR
jgi:hypothetical protein